MVKWSLKVVSVVFDFFLQNGPSFPSNYCGSELVRMLRPCLYWKLSLKTKDLTVHDGQSSSFMRYCALKPRIHPLLPVSDLSGPPRTLSGPSYDPAGDGSAKW